MTVQLLEADLDRVEESLGIDLGRRLSEREDRDDQYYPQLSAELRAQAASMGDHYETFYALERSIRELVSEQLKAHAGGDWWESCVPDPVKVNADRAVSRERESGVTPRSDQMIDYTTFGELGDIIRANWEVFAGIINNRKALDKVLANLNTLRGPIAHCSPLADDEVVRLRLAVGDWFRLME